jgi:AraC-like DNA-binding protein
LESHTDRLAPYFEKFSLSARVFFAGRLCGTSTDHQTKQAGHLHVLRDGKITVTQPNSRVLTVDEPSVLFYPRPCRHRFKAMEEQGAEIVCASIDFGAGMLNPLAASLPTLLLVPLNVLPELEPVVSLFFSEAFSQQPGRQAAVDRLAEYLMVLLLRSAVNDRLLDSGILLGLSDTRLSKAIEVMHERPSEDWSLERLAQLAGMSRARFAAHFHGVVGITPFSYLTDWRIGVAQTMLRKGDSLKIIAPAVGYMNSAALSRVFVQRLGLSPSEWLTRGTVGVL